MHVSSFIIPFGTTEQRSIVVSSYDIIESGIKHHNHMFQCSSFVYPKDDFFVVFYVVELLIFDFDSKIMRFT